MIRTVLLAALAMLAACATPAPEMAIVGAWRIEDVDAGGVIDSSRLEVTFGADGRVSGHAGCNTFSGGYTRTGATIDIGPLVSTRRACAAEALMLQEARVLGSLEAAVAVAWSPDGALILSGPTRSRLLLRRMDGAPSAEAIAPLTVSGEVYFLERIALPPGAIVRVTAQDVSRMDVAAPTLARVDAPAANGPPFAFRLDIPRGQLTPQSRVAVRAQILDGSALRFTSTEHHGVALDGPQAPLRIRVSPLPEAPGTGAGGLPITPSPQTYVCGGQTLRIAIETGVAFVTFADGQLARLERLPATGGQAPEAPRLFTNGRFTLRQDGEGGSAPVAFARGRAAFLPCIRR